MRAQREQIKTHLMIDIFRRTAVHDAMIASPPCLESGDVLSLRLSARGGPPAADDSRKERFSLCLLLTALVLQTTPPVPFVGTISDEQGQQDGPTTRMEARSSSWYRVCDALLVQRQSCVFFQRFV